MTTTQQITALKKYADYFLTNNIEVMSKEQVEELQEALQYDDIRNTPVDTTELKVMIMKFMLDHYTEFYSNHRRFMTFDEFDSQTRMTMSIESIDDDITLAAYEFMQDSIDDCIDEYIQPATMSDEYLLDQCEIISSALMDAFNEPKYDISITVGDKTGYFYDRAVLVNGLMKTISALKDDCEPLDKQEADPVVSEVIASIYAATSPLMFQLLTSMKNAEQALTKLRDSDPTPDDIKLVIKDVDYNIGSWSTDVLGSVESMVLEIIEFATGELDFFK